MKISTEFNSTAVISGNEKAIELLAKGGFDAWDFSMFDMVRCNWSTGDFTESDHPLGQKDYLKFAARLKKVGLDNGIICNQSHAPFPSTIKNIPFLQRALECTAEAGGEICIIHPGNNLGAEENAEMYNELLPFAKSVGVKIATENMWNWDHSKDQACFAACSTPESFNAHLDAVDSDHFVACLDLGHAEMKGCNTSAVEMVLALGDRLKALHIHDNDCWHDSHQIPFSMNIDFEKIAKALKTIGYSGYLTLEAGSYLSRDKYNEDNILSGVMDLAASARHFAELIEKA